MSMSNHEHAPLPSAGAMSGLFTIRSYLLLMIAAILLPMMVLVAILAWDYGAAGRRTIEAQRLDAANNLHHLMDREILATAGFLDGIAASLAGQAAAPRLAAELVAAATATGFAALVIHDRSGHRVFGAPAAAELGFATAQALGVAEVGAGQRRFVSDLVSGGGEAFKPGLFFVSVPVMVGGKVAFVLSGGLPPQRLQPLFAEAGLQEGWGAGIVDRQGIILARRLRPELYVGTLALKPMVEIARGPRSGGLFDIVSRDGVDVKNSFQRSSISGWTAAVAVPAAVVNAPLYRTALLMAAIGLVLTLVSLVLGSMVAFRISRAVRQLGVASAAFASGYPVPLPTSMLTELQDVATAMRVAADRAKRRDARARETLREPGAG
jgi:HAMP domain-containing protein